MEELKGLLDKKLKEFERDRVRAKTGVEYEKLLHQIELLGWVLYKIEEIAYKRGDL